ncbi:MAG: AMP-binding protein, partial [Sciscionella sp.]
MTANPVGDSGEPELLWRPDPEWVARSSVGRFRTWLHAERGIEVEGYQQLWQWSVDDLPGFWSAVAEFLGVRFHDTPRAVLEGPTMPGARWFPGATLNYAEQALLVGDGKEDGALAAIFQREDGLGEALTYGELRSRVAAARAGLASLGVGVGDRVVALLPNTAQTLVAFLATASLGATWSSCSPDFGARAIIERFAQIEPKVLITVDGYIYNGRTFDVQETVQRLRTEIPSLTATVLQEYVGTGDLADGPQQVI